MSFPVPVTAKSIERDVGVAEADFTTVLAVQKFYELVSNTACWYKQGGAMLITCVAKASLVDTDSMSIMIDGVAQRFEFDTAGNGVSVGSVQVNVSADTTAATVAARLRTAILATFTSTDLTVTDNADGTLTVIMLGAQLAMTETVANAGFLVAASTALAATAGAGSCYTPAGYIRYLDGKYGQTVSIIRDAADGKATLTPLHFIR